MSSVQRPSVEQALQTSDAYLTHMQNRDLPAVQALIAEEGGEVQMPREGETFSFEIGEPEVLDDLVMVPVKLKTRFEGEVDEQEMPLAVVATDDGPRISMERTFAILMGVAPDELMQGPV